MDIELFKKSIDLIQKETHITSRVFVHKEGDAEFTNFVLPPSEDAGRDNLYANSVFLLTEDGWIYFSNLNCSPTSSIVNVYTCDNCTLTFPLKPSIKKLLNHYFLQRRYLKQYHVGNFSEHIYIIHKIEEDEFMKV